MKITTTLLLLANLLVVLTFSFNTFAAPGDLDTTFSTDGMVETSIGVIDNDVDMALQADGKIVVLESLSASTNSVDRDFAFARYNSDGSLDTTFGTDGKVILAETGDQIAGGIAVQSDGKIVAVGSEASNLLVYRLNLNGSLDTSFGSGGKVIPNLGGQSLGKDIALQPDGKIVIAGQYTAVGNPPMIAVFRLNSNGTMDTSFNSTGYNRFNNNNGAATVGNAIALQSDGKIIVGGNLVNSYGIWVRVNSNGTRDGLSNAEFTNLAINDIAIQPDGKILFAGMVRLGFPKTDFAVARFNPDKTEDISFGVEGICYVNWGTTRQDKAASLIVEPSGSIIVGGNSVSNGSTKASFVRINAYGALDFGFGINGKIVTDFNNLSKLIRQPDGKVLALGSINRVQPNETNLIVARYLTGASTTFPNRTRFDFDGDGKADVAVFRPSTGYWYILRSTDNGFQGINWGLATDDIVPADYDGDGKTDLAVRRDTQWFVLRSSDNTFMLIWRIGLSGKAISADFDGDRIDDASIYFGSGWQFAPSSFDYNNVQIDFGSNNSKPFNADFDGDARADFALFSPSDGTWRIRYSTGIANSVTNFGLSTDIPVPADYDGDGKTDIAVFRPSVGDWYWLNSSNGSFTGIHWGATEDKPVPADYDGDGKADISVFRPSDGTWYINQSTAGFKAVNWGLSTDIPTPNAYIR